MIMKETEILFDQEGQPYFMTEEYEVYYLDEFIKDTSGKNEGIAYLSTSNLGGLGITIDEAGERVFYKYSKFELPFSK